MNATNTTDETEPVAVHQWTLSDADLDALEKDFPDGWAGVDGDIETHIIAAVDDLLYAGYDPDTLINSTTSPVPVEVRTHDGPIRLTAPSIEERGLQGDRRDAINPEESAAQAMTIRSIITLAVEDGPAKTTADDIARLLGNSHHNTRILHAEELQDDSVHHPRHVYSDLDAPHADNTSHVDLPMTETEAQDRMDRDGYVEVLISVDQENYHAALIAEVNGMDYSRAELCHDHSFDFGLPYDPTIQIVGVENLADTNMCNLLITYSTNISTQLDDNKD